MRRSILIASAAAATLALGACSSGETEAETPQEGTSAPEASGTLTMWVDDTRINDMKPIVEAFEEESGVTVELVQKTSGDIGPDFVAQVPTGEGPDMIVSAHDGLGEWVNNGVVAPVELGDAAEAFSPAAVSAMAVDGQNYGVPLSIENVALVRNNELLDETTATTFDELVEQAEGAGTEFSVLIQQGAESDPFHLYPLQTSFGAPVFEQNADGSYSSELALGGENGEAYASYLAELGERDVLQIEVDGEKAKQAFLDGEAPYMITGPWNTTAFTDAGMDISVLPVPSAGGEPSQPFVAVQGVFVSAKSENPVLANEFVANFLTTEAAQDILYAEGGRTPALTASADKVDDPILTGFNEAGAEGAPMPAIPEMDYVWGFWGTTEAQIIDGQADPASAWDQMVVNIQDTIDEG